MKLCAQCGVETQLYVLSKPLCVQCDANAKQRQAVVTSNLKQARVEVRRALDEVTRLKDIYVAMPKPSSDGDLAIALAQRTYDSAHLGLAKAWKEYLDTVGS